MAETGADRREAQEIARQMAGSTSGAVVLPVADRTLIRLALAVAGQWRMVATGLGGSRPVAFDMTAVDATARWLGISPDRKLFDGLVIIEREALKILRKQ